MVKIVDVKCPDSGEGGRFRLDNLDHLTQRDEIKFVISSRRRLRIRPRLHSASTRSTAKASVIFSPAFRKTAAGTRDVANCLLDPQELAQWMLADDVNARLGLQIHKFIWEPQVKGV